MAARHNWFRYCGPVAEWDRAIKAREQWVRELLWDIKRLATYVAEVADPDAEMALEAVVAEAQQAGSLEKWRVEYITSKLSEARAKERPEPDPEVSRPARTPSDWTPVAHTAAFMAAWAAKSASDADYATCPKRDESRVLLDEGVEHRAITKGEADGLRGAFEDAWAKAREGRRSASVEGV